MSLSEGETNRRLIDDLAKIAAVVLAAVALIGLVATGVNLGVDARVMPAITENRVQIMANGQQLNRIEAQLSRIETTLETLPKKR